MTQRNETQNKPKAIIDCSYGTYCGGSNLFVPAEADIRCPVCNATLEEILEQSRQVHKRVQAHLPAYLASPAAFIHRWTHYRGRDSDIPISTHIQLLRHGFQGH